MCKKIRLSLLLLLLCRFVVINFAFAADEMPVPANLQAAMFKKIFSFDKALSEVKQIKILMLYSGEAPKVMSELKTEFEKVEIVVITAEAGKFAEKIGEASAVYLLPKVDPVPIKKLCTEKGVLSISGVPELVEKGDVSVALGSEENKPKIMVNLNQLKAENHQLSADLLKLAKVIK